MIFTSREVLPGPFSGAIAQPLLTGNAIKLLAEILQQWNRERGGLQLVSLEGAAVSLFNLR